MKYLSIDLETTGVEKQKDQILSIGIVIEDTNDIKPLNELPSLHLVLLHDRLEGNPFALNMNADIIKLLRDYQVSDESGRQVLAEDRNVKFVHEHDVVKYIFDFLFKNNMLNKKVYEDVMQGLIEPTDNPETFRYIPSNRTPVSTLTVAGKNFGTFDKIFLERLPLWNDVFKIHQRILDPAILYVDWKKDELLPNLNTCMKRANIEGEVTHDAISDAKDVIKVLRTKYEVVESQTH